MQGLTRQIAACRSNRALSRALFLAAFVLASAIELCANSAPINFNRDIRPILASNCFHCHGPDSAHREADLRLDLAAEAHRDRDGAIAFKPHDLQHSAAWTRINSSDPEERMPPPSSKRTLTAEQIDLLRRWIETGAAYEEHWAFQPLKLPPISQIGGAYKVNNPIDALVLTQLAREGLKPSPEADRPTLIRRVTLDLTGLPPTLAEIDAFLKDRDENAYEKIIDRLLSSRHYAERMAVAWLDAARYADSSGWHADGEREMWGWRDWVIQAYNSNMPFDQFTIEQLAGDLLPGATPLQRTASAFNRNHCTSDESGAIDEELRFNYVVDRVQTTSAVWLGLTMECAQCHEHKFDPISQQEYYRFFAYFNQTTDPGMQSRKKNSGATAHVNDPLAEPELLKAERRLRGLESQLARRRKALQPEIDNWLAANPPEQVGADPETLRKQFCKTHDRTYRRLLEKIEATTARVAELSKPITKVMVMEEMTKPRPTYVYARGLYSSPLEDQVVTPGVPEAFPPPADSAPANRLGLAQWLVDTRNPLTARVTINRYWQMIFGTGIVATVGDFGTQGAWPSHPELLDWLAADFRDHGWDTKRTIKQMVMSATYRQAAVASPASATKDPNNQLLSRGPRFRLQAEFIRDQALALGGLLVDRLGGPSVKPYQPDGLWEEVALLDAPKYEQDHGENLYRRSLYTYWKRSALVPNMQAFDATNRERCTLQRQRTNTPLQALVTLNDPQFVEAARAFAERIMHEGGTTIEDRIRFAYRCATARPPCSETSSALQTAYERSLQVFQSDHERAQKLLSIGEAKRDEKLNLADHAAWTIVASIILNIDEILTRG